MEPLYMRYNKKDYIPNNYIYATVYETSPTHCIFHTHEYYEIELIIADSGEAIIDSTVYPANKGSLFFLSPLNVESFCGDENCRVINISFSEEACNENLLRLFHFEDSIIAITLNDYDYNFLTTLAYELINSNNDTTLSSMLLNTIVSYILKILNNHKLSRKKLSYGQSAAHYIISNFKKNITRSEAAAHVGLTPYRLSIHLKEETGLTFQEYLDSLRFNHAVKLLQLSNMSVQQICYESGFNNYENFIRRFKKLYGKSPRNYQKEFLKNKS